MKSLSSNRFTSEVAEKVRWTSSFPAAARRSFATQTIEDESSPPERQEPSGTSARRRRRTESVKSSRNRDAGLIVPPPGPIRVELVPAVDRQGLRNGIDRELDSLAAAELPDAGEHGLVRVVEKRVGEEVEGPLVVQERLPAGEHRELFDLGGEREEPGGREPVIERLDPEPVACGEDHPGLAVVDHEREHAIEPVHAVAPPLGVGVEEDLGVRTGVKYVTGGLELGAELAVVVDLAVVDDPVAVVGRAHRLVAGRREVQDGEAAMAERDADRSLYGRRIACRRRVGERRRQDALGGVGPAEEHGLSVVAEESESLVVGAAVADGSGHELGLLLR